MYTKNGVGVLIDADQQMGFRDSIPRLPKVPAGSAYV